MRHVYLDNSATTPCDSTVLSAMLPFFCDQYANPSSPHAMGKVAYTACSDARERVAQLLHCNGSEIVFTSGATESNNLLLLGLTPQSSERHRIVISQIEHTSVQGPCRVRQAHGFDVQQIRVTADGIVDLDSADELIDEHTAIVSIQAANNETGVLQPIREAAEIARSRGALFHCDAAQWIGKLPIPAWFDLCDFLTLSGHKFYGPKGAGVLMVRSGRPRRSLSAMIHGGAHEAGLRSGTLNVPTIVGLGVACSIAEQQAEKDQEYVAMLRERFESAITRALPHSWINGARVCRLPGSCSLTIPGVPASMLIANLSGICIGEGSACSSGSTLPSHVLTAMGLSREDTDSTVRISFGRQNLPDDADNATRALEIAVSRILDKSPADQTPDALLYDGSDK